MEPDEGHPPEEIRNTIRIVRVNRQYTDELQGQRLSDAHTIRASNGRFFTRQEMRNFGQLSNVTAPTYGNCENCLASGPLGKRCEICHEERNEDHMYKMVVLTRCKIVDAEFLSGFAHHPHKRAKADCLVQWVRTPQIDALGAGFPFWLNEKLHPGPIPQGKAGELMRAKIHRDQILINKLLIWLDE